jgi:hypothetical protein
MSRAAILSALALTVAVSAGCGASSPPPVAAPACTPAALGAAVQGTGSVTGAVDVVGFGCAGTWARATLALASPAGHQASADFEAYRGHWSVIFLSASDGADDGVPPDVQSRLAVLASVPAPVPAPTTTSTTAPEPTTTPGSSTTEAPSPTTTLDLPQQLQAEAAADARVLTDQGFTPLGLSDFTSYPSPGGLHVILGATSGSGGAEQAFFFVGETWLGTDTSAPSARITEVSRTPTTVTLSYGIYAAGDPQCCPSGAARDVTYQLREPHNQIVALDPIPPVTGSAARR